MVQISNINVHNALCVTQNTSYSSEYFHILSVGTPTVKNENLFIETNTYLHLRSVFYYHLPSPYVISSQKRFIVPNRHDE